MSRVRCPRCWWASVRRIVRNRAPLGQVPISLWYAAFGLHPVRHSTVVDACVDIGMVDVVDYVNREICPTRSSCQGDADVDHTNASLMVNLDDWPALEGWLRQHGVTWQEHRTMDDAISPPRIREGGWPVDYGTDVSVWLTSRGAVVSFTFRRPTQVFPMATGVPSNG